MVRGHCWRSCRLGCAQKPPGCAQEQGRLALGHRPAPDSQLEAGTGDGPPLSRGPSPCGPWPWTRALRPASSASGSVPSLRWPDILAASAGEEQDLGSRVCPWHHTALRDLQVWAHGLGGGFLPGKGIQFPDLQPGQACASGWHGAPRPPPRPWAWGSWPRWVLAEGHTSRPAPRCPQLWILIILKWQLVLSLITLHPLTKGQHFLLPLLSRHGKRMFFHFL